MIYEIFVKITWEECDAKIEKHDDKKENLYLKTILVNIAMKY